jgi:hypothetical protein
MLIGSKTKRAQSLNSFVSVTVSWLELENLFQTSEDLNDPEWELDVEEVRELFDNYRLI